MNGIECELSNEERYRLAEPVCNLLTGDGATIKDEKNDDEDDEWFHG